MNKFINKYSLKEGMAKYMVVIEKGEDGYLISEVIGLPGCHTQAKSIDELMERTKEAIKAYLGPEEDSEKTLDFVGVQQIEV